MIPWWRRAHLLLGVWLLLAALTACGRGTHPAIPPPAQGTGEPVDLAPITTGPGGALLPLARYEVTLPGDGSDPTLSYIPDRTNAARGDRFFLDLTTGADRGSLLLQLINVRRQGGRLGLTLRVRHPIPLPSSLPDPSQGRLDLHLFGPMAIVLSEAAGIDPANGAIENLRLDAGLLLNPMGYTAAIPAAITNTTTRQHPYRVFFREDPAEDPSNLGRGNFTDADGFADLANPRGFNVFPQGSTATTELLFPVSSVTRSFQLLIGAHYVEPKATDADRLPHEEGGPVYFAPAGAGTSPWALAATVRPVDLAPKDTSGRIDLTVRVYDWQIGRNADPLYPDPEFPGGIPQASTIERVRVFLPGFSDDPLEKTAADNAGAASGFFDAPLRYEFSIPNSKGAVGGSWLGLIVVEDTADAAGGPRGAPASGGLYTLESTTVYQTFVAVVPAGTEPPVAALDEIEPFEVGDTITLVARGCDPDGVLAAFQWDFNFNGTFMPMLELPVAEGALFQEITIPPPSACVPTGGPVRIAIRAVDNDGFLSEVICDDPTVPLPTGADLCALPPGTRLPACRDLVILPRDSDPEFTTKASLSGSPAAVTPFADTRSSGQHGLVVSPNGRQLWIVYHVVRNGFDTGNVFIARSTNSGASFNTAVNLSQITPEQPERPGDPPPPGPVANHPALALYENDGKLHPVVAYAKGPYLDQDIHFRISADEGETFSNEVRVERTGNQGQPALAIGPDGALLAAFTSWHVPGGDEILVARGIPGQGDLSIAQVNDVADNTGATVRWRTDYLVSQTAPALVKTNAELVVIWSDAAVVGNSRARIMSDRTALTQLSFGPDLPVSPLPPVGTYHFEPSPVLRPDDSALFVAYRDSRLEGEQLVMDVRITRQQGSSFGTPVQISDATGAPRYVFAPSLGAGPAGELFCAWQGSPVGDHMNYDLFMDRSAGGTTWGVDQTGMDQEAVIDGKLRKEQALNPYLATTGCSVFLAWTGPANPADQNNTWAVWLNIGN